ncbi:FtsX-like permease family protein [Arthrobacter sp. H5]|uniref:FtsX-like permease family protein n=1 Tax=Arthrobacter sp. H5 TaxID=1267973 RepID=UPI0004856B7A|nr:FtsX-like permease family protein [Arthrobacter sp. H5]
MDEGFLISGTLRAEGTSDNLPVVYTAPGHPLLEEARGAGYTLETFIYLLGDAPLLWEDILALNENGVIALSRAVVMDPPPESLAGWDAWSTGGESSYVSILLVTVVIGVFALAGISLLAGAAFAVGVKIQRRTLALLTATGTEGRTIKNVVAASGLLLGGFGATLGLLLGGGGAALTVSVTRDLGYAAFWGVHLNIWILLGLAGMGLIAALISAWAPGRTVARQNAYAALKSASVAPPASRKVFVAGLITIVLALLSGAAGVALGTSSQEPDVYPRLAPWFVGLIGVGALLLLVGTTLLLGKVVDACSRLAQRLPPAGRMAARDGARNRSRSVPAIAAVLATTALASLGVTTAAVVMDYSERNHYWSGPDQTLAIALTPALTGPPPEGEPAEPEQLDPAKVETLVESKFNEALNGVVLGALDLECGVSGCGLLEAVVPEENACPRTQQGNVVDAKDWRCESEVSSSNQPALAVGGENELGMLLGREPSPEAVQALNDGQLVALARPIVQDGSANFRITRYTVATAPGSGSEGELGTVRTLEFDAFTEPSNWPIGTVGIISPATAEAMELPFQDNTLLLQMPVRPDWQLVNNLQPALNELAEGDFVMAMGEPGIDPGQKLVLWAIAGAGVLLALMSVAIATGLAVTDARSDQATLASIGADPRFRKTLAAMQAGFTAVIGGLIGAVVGVLPVLAGTSVTRDFLLVVPWLPLAALLTATPLIGMAAAWLFTRAKLQMTRRALLQ